MNYDHILKLSDNLKEEHFHLSCGFHDKTYFLFEDANFYVAIHCKGTFEFRNADNKQLIKEIKAKSMDSGRGCYMDVLISNTNNKVTFQLPDYDWIDHYPNCDGESDRWDAKIVGINDEVVFTLTD